MSLVGQQLLQPEVGWRRYDGNTPLINYIGDTWIIHSHTGYYQGGDNVISSSKGRVEFCFYGTKLRMLGYSDPLRSDLISISIDGQTDTFTMNATGSLSLFQTVYYEIENLERKIHKVVLEDVGTRFSMDLDCLDIDEDGELIRHDYFENTHLEENLRKYGVAKYTFDETDNTIKNTLGDYYHGTPIGLTRDVGYNGYGQSGVFNGSNSYVQFSDKVVPIGEKSIRFKIFLPSYPTAGVSPCIMSTHNNPNQRGFIIEVLGDSFGIGYVTGTTNSWATTGNNYNLYINKSVFNLADGNWHDILITIGGSIGKKKVNIYIDDFSNPIASGSITGIETFHINNLVIGKWSGSGNYSVFNGKLDDVEIYAKELVFDKIPQQRVVLKSEEKYIAPIGDKVVELPNKRTETILENGLVVTTTGDYVDITKDITEYEIVSEIYEVHNNSKVFTINLSQDFKEIHNNDNN